MKVTMTLQGFDALKQAVARQPEVLRVHAGSVVGTTAFAVAQRAKALAPRGRTGALAQAITSSSSGLNGRVGIRPSMNRTRRGPEIYWRYVELGTSRMAARPFFRPAADRESPQYINRMRAIGPKLERDFSTGRYA